MSGDSINNLNMVKEYPINVQDVEYTKRLLEPFNDIIVEKFDGTTITTGNSRAKNIFIFIAISLVIIINFPKIREKSGINSYLLWLISTLLLIGVIY